GGWGASQGQDGMRGQFCIGDGETYNIPVEVAESQYGLLVNEYSLSCDGAGAGEYLGGSGVIRSYKVLNNTYKLTCLFGRYSHSPWAVNGGEEGSSNKVFILKESGKWEGPFGIKTRYSLNKGDVIQIITATGGGYGPPYNRSQDKVINDVKNGYISTHDAEQKFGVIID